MAKVLFIVKVHPNEAFAISVARETAKLLKEAGHKVIWKKFKSDRKPWDLNNSFDNNYLECQPKEALQEKPAAL